MKRIAYLTSLTLSLVLIPSACNKDDGSSPPDQKEETNEAPQLDAQQFDVEEDAISSDVIGTVTAIDPDGDNLTFSIADENNTLFTISADGNLSLAEQQNLDFETTTSHTVTVSVTDSEESDEAQITINVLNVVDHPLALEPSSFITTWTTTTENEEITIGTDEELTYSFTIDWGDGTIEEISASTPLSHNYASADTYTVVINGIFPGLTMLEDYAHKLKTLEQWGTNEWVSLDKAFRYVDMVYNAPDIPKFYQDANLSRMFSESTFNGDIGNWDMLKVQNTNGMFRFASSFNKDISNWNVENVTDMRYMFEGASAFNQDISSWKVGNVTSMVSMFEDAILFDQNLGSWDITQVESMHDMLSDSGLTDENYEKTLIGWAGQENVPSGVTLGANGLERCLEEALDAVDFLVNDKDWTIEDDGCGA